jgi:excisionase family DNA binding protein
MNTIFKKLDRIEQLMTEQIFRQKEILNVEEAAKYLGLSKSHLYKLTSRRQIPHYCPKGKKLYFKKGDLDQFLLTNRKASMEEIDQAAETYMLKHGRRYQ